MSDYAFVAERARRAFASVAKLEGALHARPDDAGLLVNLASMRRLAEQARREMVRLAEINQIEICNYRLIAIAEGGYALEHVAASFLRYQQLFTQIYDAKKNGPRSKVGAGRESEIESALDFAYSYSGSLGVTLLARSERTFFSGGLDEPIDALYQLLEVANTDDVKDLARTLGNAVVKRVHDWSYANVNGGFSADIRWHRSDGRDVGQMVDRGRMERIVDIIGRASDEETFEVLVTGVLVGIDVDARTFHLAVPNGEDYRGRLAQNFKRESSTIQVPKTYGARISRTEKRYYATERYDLKYELEGLVSMDDGPNSISAWV